MPIPVQTVFGVDFSGAKLAGRNAWIARCDVATSQADKPLRLVELQSLESMCGCAERETALRALVDRVNESENALWGMDFPFGLPAAIFNEGTNWTDQLQMLRDWPEQAKELGLWCVGRARAMGDKLHIRRKSDREVKTPFDCYHYRIIYQTFHGMRDVLTPLIESESTCVLPFQYERLAKAKRVVVEACPGSTLKRMGLPHNNYKQPTGGPLTMKRRTTRKVILAGLASLVEMSESHRRCIMRNPGGDALDAVIAAVGTWWAWRNTDHANVRRDEQYVLEGRVYC